jgi:uncharacterized protein (DUF427 family)
MTESVWDYPRPPALEPSSRRARVEFGGAVIADSRRTQRLLETSHPPVIYFPRDDIRGAALLAVPGHRTYCEFKGMASYFDVIGDNGLLAPMAAWTYRNATPTYAALNGHVAFYPGRMDACFLDDERVTSQEGDFYGGWITSNITGPFKGAAGTQGW